MIDIISNKQNQQTIREAISISGIGLHSGNQVEMKLVPAEVDQGVKFIRSDKSNNNVINAIWSICRPDKALIKCSIVEIFNLLLLEMVVLKTVSETFDHIALTTLLFDLSDLINFTP